MKGGFMIAILVVCVISQASAAVEARPVTDVLVSLVETTRSGESGPRVTLTLEGGTQFSGVVADLSLAGVAVVDGEVLHFVDPSAVVAVSVPSGSRAMAPASRAVTKLDVQRRAEDLARGLTELFGGAPVKVEIAWKGAGPAGLAESGDGLAVVAAALEEAAAGVRFAAAFTGEEASRRDLARRLKRIRIGDSPRAGASFSGDTLSVGVAPASGPAGRPSAWEVRRALTSP